MSGDKKEDLKKIESPNKEAQILIDEALQALTDRDAPSKKSGINGSENQFLEKLASMTDKADFIASMTGQGAIIVSSTGSITRVGEFTPNVMMQQKEHHKEMDYMKQEILSALQSDNKIDTKEKQKIEALDEIFKEVAVVVTDKGDAAVIATPYGSAVTVKPGSRNK